jgi:uncharacterized membrane protein
MPEATGFWAGVGRLHPFVVHFPVALILAALLAEALCIAKREGRYTDAARFMVAVAAWAAVLSALTGLLRADGRVFEADKQGLFALHRLAGIATPVLAFLASALAEGSRRTGQIWELYLYRIALLLAAASAAAAGYYGGEIVFGPDFFPLW